MFAVTIHHCQKSNGYAYDEQENDKTKKNQYSRAYWFGIFKPAMAYRVDKQYDAEKGNLNRQLQKVTARNYDIFSRIQNTVQYNCLCRSFSCRKYKDCLCYKIIIQCYGISIFLEQDKKIPGLL